MISLRSNPNRTIAFGAATICLIASLGMSIEFLRSEEGVSLWNIGLCLFDTVAFVFVGLRYRTRAD